MRRSIFALPAINESLVFHSSKRYFCCGQISRATANLLSLKSVNINRRQEALLAADLVRAGARQSPRWSRITQTYRLKQEKRFRLGLIGEKSYLLFHGGELAAAENAPRPLSHTCPSYVQACWGTNDALFGGASSS